MLSIVNLYIYTKVSRTKSPGPPPDPSDSNSVRRAVKELQMYLQKAGVSCDNQSNYDNNKSNDATPAVFVVPAAGGKVPKVCGFMHGRGTRSSGGKVLVRRAASSKWLDAPAANFTRALEKRGFEVRWVRIRDGGGALYKLKTRLTYGFKRRLQRRLVVSTLAPMKWRTWFQSKFAFKV